MVDVVNRFYIIYALDFVKHLNLRWRELTYVRKTSFSVPILVQVSKKKWKHNEQPHELASIMWSIPTDTMNGSWIEIHWQHQHHHCFVKMLACCLRLMASFIMMWKPMLPPQFFDTTWILNSFLWYPYGIKHLT